MVGLAQGALDLVIPYIKERIQFGQKLWNFQVGGIRFCKAEHSMLFFLKSSLSDLTFKVLLM